MIYCFSGTGNTRHVAAMLARRIGHEIHEFTADELRHPEKVVIVNNDDPIIWAFPTYSWGVPPVVRNIIHRTTYRTTPDTRHIAVTTCGDDIGNLASMFRRDIAKAGQTPGAVFSVMMPNTYVMMKGFDTDSESLARQKIENALQTVSTIADAIKAGRTETTDDMTVRGKFAGFKTTVIYPWFVRFDMSPKGFNVDGAKCVKCGRCGRACPMDNITFNAERLPVWGKECAFCTACYHVCPVYAVNWKKATLNKGRVKYFNQPTNDDAVSK